MIGATELKRRARRSALEGIQNSLSLFYHVGIGEAEALPLLVELALQEFKQARQNLRTEGRQASTRIYNKFSVLCAVQTIVHVRKMQHLGCLGLESQS